MLIKNIPDDLNIEILLSYLPAGSYKVVLKGVHKRNSYKDIIETEERPDDTMLIGIGRNSLYNSLPENLFHPIDRFDNLPKLEEKERFAEEYRKQEEEKDNAYRFFAPIDLFLLKQRTIVRERLNEYADGNKVLIDILCDKLSKKQRTNRFIKQVLQFIPACKDIRGNKTLLTFMLRKVLMEEGIKIDSYNDVVSYQDISARYADSLDSRLGEGFVGNAYDELTTIYSIHYWPDDECNENFLTFVRDIDIFRAFVQDFFLSIEETLVFKICKDSEPLRLSDNVVYNYLNYNTNI